MGHVVKTRSKGDAQISFAGNMSGVYGELISDVQEEGTLHESFVSAKAWLVVRVILFIQSLMFPLCLTMQRNIDA